MLRRSSEKNKKNKEGILIGGKLVNGVKKE